MEGPNDTRASQSKGTWHYIPVKQCAIGWMQLKVSKKHSKMQLCLKIFSKSLDYFKTPDFDNPQFNSIVFNVFLQYKKKSLFIIICMECEILFIGPFYWSVDLDSMIKKRDHVPDLCRLVQSIGPDSIDQTTVCQPQL